jgi:altronate dehydratase
MNQPPTGLPLIPVITVANEQSPLHQALASEFDALHSISPEELLQKVISVANGEKSKSESKKVGDIVVPRMVRSV